MQRKLISLHQGMRGNYYKTQAQLNAYYMKPSFIFYRYELGCDLGLQLNRTTWNLTQAARGFRFESLDLGFKLDGIFQDIVAVPLFGGGDPVKCAVSRHNTFSLSDFCLHYSASVSRLLQTLSSLPFALVPLFALFSIIILLIWGHSYWCWLLSGHMAMAEMAHTGTASSLFFTHTHS